MKENKKHILIIDDDKEITLLIKDYLSQNGYQVTYAFDGLSIERLMNEHDFELAILDVMLPQVDGLSLIKTIRQRSAIPIMMLSAAMSEADRVAGLELGADDYMVKPFGSRELLARVKALLRRSQGELSQAVNRLSPLAKLQFSCWVLDREKHCLINDKKIAIALSHREYDLLLIFLEHPKRVLSRGMLTELLYDKESEPFDRSIDVLIGRIRKKIEHNSKKPNLLKTIRGGGYMLDTKVERIE